jgi:hypothetical protein
VIRLLRWLVVTEINGWRSLFFWVTRRVPGRRPGSEAYSYTRDVGPIIGVFIFLSFVELPVVHLLIPWDTVRLVVLILSVWGVLWMLGLLAGVIVYKHLLDDDGLRIRYGATVDIRIPAEAIAGVTARRGSAETGKNVEVDGTALSVPVVKQTRVEVLLCEPTTLAGHAGITEVRFYANDERGLVAAARERFEIASVQDRGRAGAVQRWHER